jgi:hypothetical protein
MTGARGLIAAALVSALALLVGVAVSAATDRQPVKSTVTLTSLTATGASGKVAAKQKACRRDRKVRLLIEPQGGGGEHPGSLPVVPIASTMTAKDGSWKISKALQPGRTYIAAVDFHLTGKFGCRYDESPEQQLLPVASPASG